MGLAQKRISQEYQQNVFPEWKKKLDMKAGFEVPMEVRWDTMMSDDYTQKDQYFEWYDRVYFNPLMAAISSVASDAMGREALKGALKKIVIDGSEGSGPHNTKFEGGTLLIQHRFSSNVDAEDERRKGWTQLLESKL